MGLRSVLLFCCLIPCFQAACVFNANTCSNFISGGSADAIALQSACAVVFDEGCCASGDRYVIPAGGEGKFCSSVSFGSSCNTASGLRNDIESFIVQKRCTLELWDDDDGLEDAKVEEAKGAAEGVNRNTLDIFNENKVLIRGGASKHTVIKELNDDFDDMNEAASSYRCTCS
jgi:hypothetical protein